MCRVVLVAVLGCSCVCNDKGAGFTLYFAVKCALRVLEKHLLIAFSCPDRKSEMFFITTTTFAVHCTLEKNKVMQFRLKLSFKFFNFPSKRSCTEVGRLNFESRRKELKSFLILIRKLNINKQWMSRNIFNFRYFRETFKLSSTRPQNFKV